MSELVKVAETDNRDMDKTVLVLSNGTVVEVDPTYLFVNALDNADRANALLEVLEEVLNHGSTRTAAQYDVVTELYNDLLGIIG